MGKQRAPHSAISSNYRSSFSLSVLLLLSPSFSLSFGFFYSLILCATVHQLGLFHSTHVWTPSFFIHLCVFDFIYISTLCWTLYHFNAAMIQFSQQLPTLLQLLSIIVIMLLIKTASLFPFLSSTHRYHVLCVSLSYQQDSFQTQDHSTHNSLIIIISQLAFS